ncbi:MAG: tRNA (guanosine(46)-N7)-methyltransferase TrmB [Eubacteriales bacterium]|nr:tRNA (guanosine(46)-N7)-methyltransferase TrmB [Eubacteriales bacterium]
MRLRNIPRAEGVLQAHPIVMKEETTYKGKWKQEFGNNNPIHIEIGMGKGQFLLALADQNPGINYIGIERYSSVLLRAVEKYEEFCGRDGMLGVEPGEMRPLKIDGRLPNIRFVCMDAADIADVFAQDEVAKIYLNFSDPWPKKRHARRRLTSREFLGRYQQIMDDEGVVEFKTDNHDLFQFSLEEVEAAGWKLEAYTWDLHNDEKMNRGNVMTEYEAKFSSMGNSIHKLIATR